jgi:integrase
MSGSLFDQRGARKYLVSRERRAFVAAALMENERAATFCLTLALSGARISEVLSLTGEMIDFANRALIFRTLKQRGKVVFRAVPVPRYLLSRLRRMGSGPGQRLWPWRRTTAWALIKSIMREARIAEPLCKPKSLRHGFAVEAGQRGVPLNIVQRWLGHARIETTAIYASALGPEERNLARRTWSSLAVTMNGRPES